MRASTTGQEFPRPKNCVAQAWIAKFSLALRPYVDGAYVNVPNIGMAEWETAYWTSNFCRLRRIKSKYDPTNLFHCPWVPSARRTGGHPRRRVHFHVAPRSAEEMATWSPASDRWSGRHAG
ncbi:BBE domain-containing protein [Actinopolymorpha singaporensis]|uniref:BBE domain-containing protein n=1 Tax=Actinopolymorpha singaporensis TaxID=117157 RepID=UPI000A77A237|nr:BBE domain-containing protein [Actinopolymorpha singaporensis]